MKVVSKQAGPIHACDTLGGNLGWWLLGPTLGDLGKSGRKIWSIVHIFQNEHVEGELAIMVLTKTSFPVIT